MIAVGPDGNLWFASVGNNISKSTTAGVITEYTIPTAGADPHGVSAGPDGNVWFTESGANKIGRITPAGTFTEFTIPTAGTQPLGISAGPDGNLWFVGYEGNQVGKVTPAGVFTEYPLPTELSRPYSIVAGPDGNMWFTEVLNKKIGRITPAGVITEFAMPDSHAPFIITAGPDGNLWATTHHAVARITTAGVITEFPTVDPDGAPNFIGAGPDGNVWFSDIGHGNKISMVTPAGVVTEYPFYNGLPSGVVSGPDGSIWTITSFGLVKVDIVPDPTGEFTSLTPERILDTRTTLGGHQGKVGAGQSFDVQVTGKGGVPASGVSAVVLNVTVTDPTDFSYLTVWPTGRIKPVVSNLNYEPGQTVPNLVTVKLGDNGKVSVFNNAGAAHVVMDVAGFYADGDGPLGGRYHGVTPSRILDTRNSGPIAPNGTTKLKVTGVGGVPNSADVTGVVMNVTVTQPTGFGFLTVWPDDTARPVVSNLNFTPGLTVPNLVTVRVPANGIIDFYNSFGSTHVVVDVVGYYDGEKSTEAGRFVALDPMRIVDTRVLTPFPPPGWMPPGAALFHRPAVNPEPAGHWDGIDRDQRDGDAAEFVRLVVGVPR